MTWDRLFVAPPPEAWHRWLVIWNCHFKIPTEVFTQYTPKILNLSAAQLTLGKYTLGCFYSCWVSSLRKLVFIQHPPNDRFGQIYHISGFSCIRRPYYKSDWLSKVLHPVLHNIGSVRRPCKGHGTGCSWLLLKPMTGGNGQQIGAGVRAYWGWEY